MATGYTRFENEEADIGTAESIQPSCPSPEQVDAPPPPASGPYTQSCLNDLPTYQGPQQLQPVAYTEQPASTGVSNLPLKPLPSADESGQTPPHPSAGLPAAQENAPPSPDSTLPSGGTPVITCQPETRPVDMNVTPVQRTDITAEIESVCTLKWIFLGTYFFPFGILFLIYLLCWMYSLKEEGDYEGVKMVSRFLRCILLKAILIAVFCAIAGVVIYFATAH